MSLKYRAFLWLLFLGDLAAVVFSLWLTLWIRYGVWPARDTFFRHWWPFFIIFIFWFLVFFVFDLYRRPEFMFKEKLSRVIFRAQVVNGLLAIAFFYLMPSFGIAPKSILFIDLAISFFLIALWRLYVVDWLARRRPLGVVFLCDGSETEELKRALSGNSRFNFLPVSAVAAKSTLSATLLVVNVFGREVEPEAADRFYRLLFTGASIITLHRFYEMIFNRVPIASINERWFFEYVENITNRGYATVKRLMDIIIGSLLFGVSLPFYPFICLAIKLGDRGPIFYREERVGKNGVEFPIVKFRSMTTESDFNARRVTAAGAFLRRTRLDELPQLLSVIVGRQSLVGPRPERPQYVALYRDQIPYYDARHLITPGLSGWAQLYQENHPHFQPGVESTKEKLSYDLYYIEHRGILLDLAIALKTIKALFARTGI